jgi:hypothetical protein
VEWGTEGCTVLLGMSKALTKKDFFGCLFHRASLWMNFSEPLASSLKGMTSPVLERTAFAVFYVPISQEERYFSCSGVSVSISTPMDASLRRAISLSISSGTG